MRIGLYGIYGTYNFGCEAIVRGTQRFIRDIYPNSQIVYFSYSYDYDRIALADTDIQIVPVKLKKNIFKRCINKLLDYFNYDKRLFLFKKDIFKDVDLIFSIGGDIYTIPEVLRNRHSYKYYNPLVDFCNRCNKPVVVYGASVGPWGNYKKAIDYYCNNLVKYKAILCREKETLEYLKGFAFNNVVFFPDPAFLLGGGEEDNREYIGINLSPLSLKELYGEVSEIRLIQIATVIDRIIEKFNMPVMFIPHVLSADNEDNDLHIMGKIKGLMRFQDRVIFSDSSNGFLGTKKCIRKCHVVVAARMHCAINAIEENIPTIFLTYSQKSIGMCDYVYRTKKWVLDLKDIEEKLIPLLSDMMNRKEEIKKQLSLQNNRIKLDYSENILKVKKMLHSIM